MKEREVLTCSLYYNICAEYDRINKMEFCFLINGSVTVIVKKTFLK
jgi:hypothetical protein